MHWFLYNEEYGISSWTAGYESGMSEKIGLSLKRLKNLHQKLLHVLREPVVSHSEPAGLHAQPVNAGCQLRRPVRLRCCSLIIYLYFNWATFTVYKRVSEIYWA
jgi:hypothetical protein